MTDDLEPVSSSEDDDRHGDAVNSAGLRWITLEESRSLTATRPNPLRWLLYAFGAGLPDRNREWVLKDTTCRTWVLRQLVRSLIMLVIPVAAVLIFLPADAGLRILTAVTAGSCGLMFMLVHIIETTERRVVRAGYIGGTAERLRHERSIGAQRLANQQRRDRIAARRAKRLERR